MPVLNGEHRSRCVYTEKREFVASVLTWPWYGKPLSPGCVIALELSLTQTHSDPSQRALTGPTVCLRCITARRCTTPISTCSCTKLLGACHCLPLSVPSRWRAYCASKPTVRILVRPRDLFAGWLASLQRHSLSIRCSHVTAGAYD